jgi:hypothetical protein
MIMSKVADFFITGVWKDSQKRITDVMLHAVNEDGSFKARGSKTNKVGVIALLKNKKVIMTLTWDYPGWNQGAYVTYENIGGQEFLRTAPNSSLKDNLDNSFPFDLFI